MGTDLLQVSAHIGARNKGEGPMNHESWQGKIYSISGESKRYPDFYTVTGYGTGLGLHGFNCRHSFYPFIHGISVKGPLRPRAYKGKTVTYKGQKIDFYEATQIQRRIERDIRKAKRVWLAEAASPGYPDPSKAKIEWYQAKMRAFIKETKLNRQYEREQVRS